MTELEEGTRLAVDFGKLDRLLDGRSFPDMTDWTVPWWNKYPDAGAYPDFYLRHCCGFAGDIDRSLSVEPDREFRAEAMGRKIIALSMSGSSASTTITVEP